MLANLLARVVYLSNSSHCRNISNTDTVISSIFTMSSYNMSYSPNNKQSSKTSIVNNLSRSLPSSCHTIPVDVLDELAARFLINIPLEERQDLIRVCFQVELAHWFYIDFYLPKYSTLVECSIKEFAAHMFHHVPFLQKYKDEVDEVVETWWEYKLSVPVNGAILLNATMDKVLMVQGFNRRGGWAFPKGKVNECEEPYDCATREVLEETGFDVGELIQKDLYLEQVVNNQTVRLYLVPGVAETTDFCPRSRGEISNIQWWDLASLPIRVGDKTTKDRLGLSPHMFYNVIPFIKSIRKWVDKQTSPPHRQVPPKARESVMEREIKNSSNNEQEDAFCPISWKNFRLNLEHIEQNKTTDSQSSKRIQTSFKEFINRKTDPQLCVGTSMSLKGLVSRKMTDPLIGIGLKEFINQTGPLSSRTNTSLEEFIHQKTGAQSGRANTSLKQLINQRTDPQSNLDSSTSWKDFLSQISKQASNSSGESSSCSL